MTAIPDIIKNMYNLPEGFKSKLLQKVEDNKYATSDALAGVDTIIVRLDSYMRLRSMGSRRQIRVG